LNGHGESIAVLISFNDLASSMTLAQANTNLLVQCPEIAFLHRRRVRISTQKKSIRAGTSIQITGNTGTQFDNANIVGSSGISSGGNQMLHRLAMTHRC
jgi:hypothetical protein